MRVALALFFILSSVAVCGVGIWLCAKQIQRVDRHIRELDNEIRAEHEQSGKASSEQQDQGK